MLSHSLGVGRIVIFAITGYICLNEIFNQMATLCILELCEAYMLSSYMMRQFFPGVALLMIGD